MDKSPPPDPSKRFSAPPTTRAPSDSKPPARSSVPSLTRFSTFNNPNDPSSTYPTRASPGGPPIGDQQQSSNPADRNTTTTSSSSGGGGSISSTTTRLFFPGADRPVPTRTLSIDLRPSFGAVAPPETERRVYEREYAEMLRREFGVRGEGARQGEEGKEEEEKEGEKDGKDEEGKEGGKDGKGGKEG